MLPFKSQDAATFYMNNRQFIRNYFRCLFNQFSLALLVISLL